MTIQFNGQQLSTKRLGSTKINKIMLGVTEVFPRVVPPIITSVPGGAPVFTQYQAIVPFSFVSTGGVGPYVYTIVAGALPTGITMTTGGYFSGTPTVSGPFTVTFRTTDSQARYSDQEYTGHVVEAGQAYTPYDLFSPTDTGGWWDSGDLGYTASELVLGPEVNPSPEFDSATGWFVGSNNNITGGQFVAQNGWSSGQSSYANALMLGKTYFVEFEVVEFIGIGSFQVRMGNAPSVDGVITVSKTGVYQAVLSDRDASGGSRLAIECTSAAGFSMKMDYLRVKEVLSGYNPTLFQVSTGMYAVSYIDQPLGLEVDKSKGLALGTEIITNVDDREFNANTGYWAVDASASISGGVVNVNTSADIYPVYRFNGTTKAGYYEISYDLTVVSGGCAGWLNNGLRHTTSGSYRDRFYAPNNSTIGMRTLGPFVGTIDNISIREVEGNHLTMATAGARPLWSKRVNQNTYSEDFTVAAAYRNRGVTIAPAPDGTFSNGKRGMLITNDGSATHSIDCYPTLYGQGGNIRVSIFVKNVDATYVQFRDAPAGRGIKFTFASELVEVTGNAVDPVAENLGNGEYRLSVTLPRTPGNAFDYTTILVDGDIASSASCYATGWQSEFGTVTSPYQVIGAAADYASDGYPAYDKYDGTDDNLSNADLVVMSSGTELYACFGVMVNAQAAFGILAESGVSNADGGFYIGVSGTVLEVRINGAGGTFYFEEFSMTGFVNDKVTIDVVMDRNAVMAQTAVQVSFNGVPQTRTTITNTFSGNGTLFKANPIYFGSRAGSSLRFSGFMYNKTILGRKPTTDERISQQNWSMAQMEVTP